MGRYLQSITLVASLAFVGLLTFSVTAHAQSAVTSPDSSVIDIARPIYNAFAGGQYAYAAALLVVLLVGAAKRYGGTGKFARIIHSDAGGAMSALTAAAAMSVASALATPGAHVTFELLKTSLFVGVGAAGGYAVLKNVLVDPFLRPLHAWLPEWAQPGLRAVLWIFDKKADFDDAPPVGPVQPAMPTPVASAPVTAPSAPAPQETK